MVNLIDLIEKINRPIKLYRGLNPKFGEGQLGKMSIGIKHKLVSALGPNYTNNEEIAKLYGSQIISTTVLPRRVLKLKNYDDIISLYKQYESQLTPNLAKKIKYSSGDDQLELINQAGMELREILSDQYDSVKSPFYQGDYNFIKSKGLKGSIYIVLTNV